MGVSRRGPEGGGFNSGDGTPAEKKAAKLQDIYVKLSDKASQFDGKCNEVVGKINDITYKLSNDEIDKYEARKNLDSTKPRRSRLSDICDDLVTQSQQTLAETGYNDDRFRELTKGLNASYKKIKDAVESFERMYDTKPDSD